MEQLKTFEDACKIEGLDPKNFELELPTVPKRDKEAIVAFTKLIVIVRAANRLDNDGYEWRPNWSDYNERKYTAWFEMKSSSGFRFDADVNWNAYSDVGSRLCFKSMETCRYIGKQFEDLFKQLMVIEQN